MSEDSTSRAERSEVKTGKIDTRDMPLFYRLILKLPLPSLDFLPDVSHGIFWAVIMPIFVVLESYLGLFLLVAFSFPTNIVLVGVIPGIILLFFLRIQLERFINWWNATIAQQGFEWNVEKATREYLDLQKNHKSKKNEES